MEPFAETAGARDVECATVSVSPVLEFVEAFLPCSGLCLLVVAGAAAGWLKGYYGPIKPYRLEALDSFGC